MLQTKSYEAPTAAQAHSERSLSAALILKVGVIVKVNERIRPRYPRECEMQRKDRLGVLAKRACTLATVAGITLGSFPKNSFRDWEFVFFGDIENQLGDILRCWIAIHQKRGSPFLSKQE